MPELPEVHTIVLDIKNNFEGYKIEAVGVEYGYKTHPDNESFSKILINKQISKVGRIGKNIVIKINSNLFLTFHLAMTGRILIRKQGSPKEPHQKVELTLSKGGKTTLLRFCDMRMFGKVGIWDAVDMAKLKQKYGPDITTQEITSEQFLDRLKSKNTSIKNALLEQSIVAGLGNIYATDALWMAKIHPDTKTSKLDLNQASNLLKSAKTILLEGISHRGSTLPDEAYVDIFGKAGSHQNYFRVYGKSSCSSCKGAVAYKKINGRGTYFCPSCQK
jgi:formamidopyrimidine-DNA glycosylase